MHTLVSTTWLCAFKGMPRSASESPALFSSPILHLHSHPYPRERPQFTETLGLSDAAETGSKGRVNQTDLLCQKPPQETVKNQLLTPQEGALDTGHGHMYRSTPNLNCSPCLSTLTLTSTPTPFTNSSKTSPSSETLRITVPHKGNAGGYYPKNVYMAR